MLPSDPVYATARQRVNPRFDRVNPAAIALCRSIAGVQQPIAFARGHDVTSRSTQTIPTRCEK
ncbi:MAG: hypothetical protein ACRDZ4_07120 [Egibacteraceae bacterium]